MLNPSASLGIVVVDAFPLDAVAPKLMFGARPGVTLTVVTGFIAHLEHNLGLLRLNNQTAFTQGSD